MGEPMHEVTVASLGLDKASNTPVVILKEKEGDRVLPIWIGPGEASAIAMKLAGIQFSRPLTHDLLSTVVRGLGSELVRVLITKVVENTYYASLIFRRDGELISIDSRPSDSIALALRAEAPIFADEDLLELTALEIEEADFEPGEGEAEFLGTGGQIAESETTGAEEGPRGEGLREYLKGLNPEDFGRFTP
ncbi:MAG: bifunctional nuclease family protein [Candidatus Palauibacterales bacterium]|nr:bifunctional nuclease family protein [Candidatus Palauibacterales bacterium]MDP2530205.1 bifunctional nuclease family protein [Candidatus Palauibacterales bacterium]MDP2584590.1 bifunctional nuclease family protein [Candidatus Palauibacterales bacterium]